MTVTARISLETRYWTWLHVACNLLSVGSWFLFLALMSIISYGGTDSSSGDSSSYGIMGMVGKLGLFWSLGIGCAVISLLPWISYNAFSAMLFPTREQAARAAIVQDMQIAPQLARQSKQPPVAAGFFAPSAKLALANTNTFHGLDSEDDPTQAYSVARLLKALHVARLAKRWVKGFRHRKAERKAMQGADLVSTPLPGQSSA